MDEEDIRRHMEDEYMQGLLDEQEEMRQQYEKEEQEKLDEAVLQQALEEERMFDRMDLQRERQEQEWAAMMDPYSEFRFPEKDPDVNDRDRAHFTFIHETQESVTMGTVVQASDLQSASVQAPSESVQPAQEEGSSAAGNSKKKKRRRLDLFQVMCPGSITSKGEDQRELRTFKVRISSLIQKEQVQPQTRHLMSVQMLLLDVLCYLQT